MRLPEFAAIIRGIAPAALNPFISPESLQFGILAKYRSLLQRTDSDLVGSLDALRDSWVDGGTAASSDSGESKTQRNHHP